MFPNKCVTVDAAIRRYGPIDLASGHWPGVTVHLKMLELDPKLLVNLPNWKVLDTQISVTHIACNRDMHGPLMNALASLAHLGLGGLLKTFDGAFDVRPVRGMAAMSTHAYGLGIDLNAADNPLGATKGGFYEMPEFVKCFTEQGFDWGGNFHARKDPMHFSYAWEGPPEQAIT